MTLDLPLREHRATHPHRGSDRLARSCPGGDARRQPQQWAWTSSAPRSLPACQIACARRSPSLEHETAPQRFANSCSKEKKGESETILLCQAKASSVLPIVAYDVASETIGKVVRKGVYTMSKHHIETYLCSETFP